ncbi:DUF397 domain-containing protein [Actinomadura citrea]|uniref:DUF397 domain-containing protein n=1 Tax=Actinomadura citrea TaxID=46158 RepID=UPI003CE5BED4
MSILRSRVPPPRLSARLPKRYQRPQASPPGFYDARPAWAVAPWPAEEAVAPAWSVRLPSGREHAVFEQGAQPGLLRFRCRRTRTGSRGVRVHWREAVRSRDDGDQCGEIASGSEGVALRDSKDPDGLRLVISM